MISNSSMQATCAERIDFYAMPPIKISAVLLLMKEIKFQKNHSANKTIHVKSKLAANSAALLLMEINFNNHNPGCKT